MRQSKPESPNPEQLAAYVDGELDPAQGMDLEIWLRNHLEAAAQIEQHRDLARVWQETAAIEPAAEKWAAVLERIECGLSRSRALAIARRRLVRAGVAVAVAATVLLVLVWHPRATPLKVEPLTVVSPDEVEIVSLRAADRRTLIVGVPPVTGPLVFASPRDVELERVEPDGDGMMPDIHMDDSSDTAMIVAPSRAVIQGGAVSAER
jgi:anti-sigma factor RsiW